MTTAATARITKGTIGVLSPVFTASEESLLSSFDSSSFWLDCVCPALLWLPVSVVVSDAAGVEVTPLPLSSAEEEPAAGVVVAWAADESS